MKFDFQLLFVMIVIGLMAKSLTAKVWACVVLLIVAWMMYNWLRG